MTPEELRAAIPALEDAVYLNTGASGPSPEPVIEATTDAARRHEAVAPTGDGAYTAAFERFDEARTAVAGFLGADEREVALTQSTSDGLARVAPAFDWESGDAVVRTVDEHAAGILPWWNLEAEGVETRVLDTDRGHIDPEELKKAVAPEEVRVLCFNSLTWNWGTRTDVDRIVDIAHDADTRVVVDAVQSVGQGPLDVTDWGADVVVGAGHKWLLGPWGAGFLYVSPDCLDELHPNQVGYRSVETTDPPRFVEGAPRFEVGTTSPAPYAGVMAAIETMESVGLGTVADRIERLAGRLREGLGDRLLSPPGTDTGLVTFAAEDPDATVERLDDADIRIRTLEYPEAVRASVHAFNTAEDVDALLEALGDGSQG